MEEIAAVLDGESFQAYESGRIERSAECRSKAATDDYVFNRAALPEAR